MIVTITYEGRPFGSPMADLREDDLLWFIRSQLELGREVHILPDGKHRPSSQKDIPPCKGISPKGGHDHD